MDPLVSKLSSTKKGWIEVETTNPVSGDGAPATPGSVMPRKKTNKPGFQQIMVLKGVDVRILFDYLCQLTKIDGASFEEFQDWFLPSLANPTPSVPQPKPPAKSTTEVKQPPKPLQTKPQPQKAPVVQKTVAKPAPQEPVVLNKPLKTEEKSKSTPNPTKEECQSKIHPQIRPLTITRPLDIPVNDHIDPVPWKPPVDSNTYYVSIQDDICTVRSSQIDIRDILKNISELFGNKDLKDACRIAIK
mgnify:CR=1 FL=1